MSWDEKDWDFLDFYNKDEETLRKAADEFLHIKSRKSSYIDNNYIHFNYKRECLSLYRYSKDIWPPNEYDQMRLQHIANYYDVCITYYFTGYRFFDIKPIIEE